MSSAPLSPKDHCFLELSQTWPVYPSGKGNVYMKVCMQRWSNDTGRENRSTPRIPFPSATTSTTILTWTDLESKPASPVTGRRLTACVSLCSIHRLEFLKVSLCSPWGRTPQLYTQHGSLVRRFPHGGFADTRELLSPPSWIAVNSPPPLTRGQVCEAKHKRPHLGRASPVAT